VIEWRKNLEEWEGSGRLPIKAMDLSKMSH